MQQSKGSQRIGHDWVTEQQHDNIYAWLFKNTIVYSFIEKLKSEKKLHKIFSNGNKLSIL